jgi:hypothetical protein
MQPIRSKNNFPKTKLCKREGKSFGQSTERFATNAERAQKEQLVADFKKNESKLTAELNRNRLNLKLLKDRSEHHR